MRKHGLIVEVIIYLCIGLFAGFMSRMFGIGGSSIRIPLLILAKLPLLGAFGTNLLVIPFSSSVGAISQKENIDKKIASRMIVGGTLGSIIGARMGSKILLKTKPTWLEFGLSVFI